MLNNSLLPYVTQDDDDFDLLTMLNSPQRVIAQTSPSVMSLYHVQPDGQAQPPPVPPIHPFFLRKKPTVKK